MEKDSKPNKVTVKEKNIHKKVKYVIVFHPPKKKVKKIKKIIDFFQI